ncbi:MAG: serine/threonine protein kinase, partial [Candidatus Altiarchaeota archaeon]
DLTTSNILLKDDEIYFIDFGLGYNSTRLEDKAMDLVVFKKSLQASHTKNFETIWKNIEKGYGLDKHTEKQIEDIEKRVRYAT